MGIDLLDITFRLEKTFDVPFTGEDMASLVSDRDICVGDLYDLILHRLAMKDAVRDDIELNYALWNELRGVLHEATNVPVEHVELQTPLEEIFPIKNRNDNWEMLRRLSRFRIEKLDYPAGVRTVGIVIAVTMVIVEQFRLWQIQGAIWFCPLLGLFGVWMAVETYLKVLSILTPWRTRFPSDSRTVKDLCRTVRTANCEMLGENADLFPHKARPHVWQQLVDVLVDALGVDSDEVTLESRLVADLGME